MDWTLMAFIGVCAVAASSGALFPPGKWYDSLRKPSWRPPNWLFGPAWMVLYAMIAVSGWLVWTTAAPGDRLVPMTVYGVQLALNLPNITAFRHDLNHRLGELTKSSVLYHLGQHG